MKVWGIFMEDLRKFTNEWWGILFGFLRNMYFVKEERIEKGFLWKRRNIGKGIVMEKFRVCREKSEW